MPAACTPPGRSPPPIAAGERGAEAAAALDLLKNDFLAAVRAAVRAARGLRVREVLRDDVHAQALGAEAAARDVDCVEEAHQPTPIADLRIGDAGLRHGDEGLVLEAVLRHVRGLDVDVDSVAVGADRLRVDLGRELRGLHRLARALAHGAGERAVEVDIHAAVAGGVRVREVGRDRGLALSRAGDRALESELGGVYEGHREGRITKSGRPSVDSMTPIHGGHPSYRLQSAVL